MPCSIRQHVNHRKLQPLGRVQRHHRDAILLLVPAIDVAGQRDVLKEVGDGSAIVLGVKLMGGGDEFLDVGEAFLIVRVAAVLATCGDSRCGR